MKRWLAAAISLAILSAAAGFASPAARERVGAVEIFATEGNDDILDRLYIEERHLESLERIAGQLEVAIRTKGPTDRVTLRLLMRLARISHGSRERQVAEKVFPGLVQAARANLRDDDPLLIELYLRAAISARVSLRMPEAIALLASAREVADRIGSTSPILEDQFRAVQEMIRGGLGPEQRVKSFRDGAEIYRRWTTAPSLPEAASRTWLAWYLDRAKHLDEVPAAIADARKTMLDLGAPRGSYAVVLDALDVERLILADRWDEAVVVAKRCADIAGDLRDRSMVGAISRRGLLRQCEEDLALEAVEHGRGDEAWRYLERWRAPHNIDMLTIGMWEQLDPVGWAAYRAAEARLLDARDRAMGVPGTSGFAWNAAGWRATWEWVRARLNVMRLETDFLRRYVPKEASIEAARRALGPRDALVGWLDVNVGGDPGPFSEPHRLYSWGYVLRPDRPIVWVPILRGIAADDPTFRSLTAGASLASVVRAARWPERVDDDPDLKARLRNWSHLYFDPLVPHLDGVERLVFAEARFPLNLHTLPDGRFIGERFDVAFVASGQVLGFDADRTDEAACSGASAVVIAAVAPPGATTTDDRRTRTVRASFDRTDDRAPLNSPLPFARREAQDVASLFAASRTFSGEPESMRRLNAFVQSGELERAGVVHIAAHAVTASEPEACAFSLTGERGGPGRRDDGLLDAEEMFRGWRTNVQLLTLSGCETSAAAGVGGREWFGFVAIGSAIGARKVLSSFWPVDDRATSILMKRFYENYTGRYSDRRAGVQRKAMTAERALREAQAYMRSYRDASGRTPYVHPAYWASFELVETR